jgi:N-acetylglucosamine-6-phosphate deacetylase
MVAIGHCFPDTHAVQEAVKCGASIVTHFANGVAPQIHRFKNPFWAMLENSKLKFGLICDGFHLPPELVKVALKFKGFSNCFPVSDASHWSGCPDGLYCREGYPNVVIEKNGYMHIENEDLLAGAWFQQNRCVEFLVEKVGMDFLDAWNQCSLIPAEIVGIRLPEIKKGEEASFVLANWDKGLVIEQSVHCGKPYLKQHLTTNMSSIL